MGNGILVPDIHKQEVSLYSASNSYVTVVKSGNVATMHIFNVAPSVLLNLSIPDVVQPSILLDGAIGWLWLSSDDSSRPCFCRMLATFSSVRYYSSSQGKLVNASDNNGTVFATITYITK